MVQAEDLIRRSMVRILQSDEAARSFDGNEREQYLDELVFGTR